MKQHGLNVFSSGHQFLETPRWHDGQLWASDFFAKKVLRFHPDGSADTVAELSGAPSGLGFLGDGSVLVVSQADAKVLRIDTSGSTAEYADFSDIAGGLGNDMLVTETGHAYVGNFGFAVLQEAPKPTNLAHIDAAGKVTRVEGDVTFPNGAALTPDGSLLLAETFAHRISAFDINGDGSLTNHRVWAQLPDTYHPDGIAFDAAGGVWFGNAMTSDDDSGFYRVVEGGEITDKIPVDGAWAVACAFGGPDLETLYLTCNATSLQDFQEGRSAGYIATATVGRSGARVDGAARESVA
ncbi:SMP-30/gluconolactonase/LRE family protein [Rhodococcus opacus]|uniref:SMP-30/gluconolactonase/LRE family protein n=1 Tax=Rhodococcus opacus TaxID=37919 RepID=UPI001C45AA4B|nr:SMP-30/gluconolactonase/LRE family protein [Rhodococcus opacus]MBV6761972.1 SMP-30/gluconolactonase/LRE family protein [Rhodococcus opacus]